MPNPRPLLARPGLRWALLALLATIALLPYLLLVSEPRGLTRPQRRMLERNIRDITELQAEADRDLDISYNLWRNPRLAASALAADTSTWPPHIHGGIVTETPSPKRRQRIIIWLIVGLIWLTGVIGFIVAVLERGIS